MNIASIAYILGKLIEIEGILFLLPSLVSLIYKEKEGKVKSNQTPLFRDSIYQKNSNLFFRIPLFHRPKSWEASLLRVPGSPARTR